MLSHNVGVEAPLPVFYDQAVLGHILPLNASSSSSHSRQTYDIHLRLPHSLDPYYFHFLNLLDPSLFLTGGSFPRFTLSLKR